MGCILKSVREYYINIRFLQNPVLLRYALPTTCPLYTKPCLAAYSCLILCNPMDCSPPTVDCRTVAHLPPGLEPRVLCPWGFSRQEYWGELPCPPPGDLPNSGIEPRSPTLQVNSLPFEPLGKPILYLPWLYACGNVWCSIFSQKCSMCQNSQLHN